MTSPFIRNSTSISVKWEKERKGPVIPRMEDDILPFDIGEVKYLNGWSSIYFIFYKDNERVLGCSISVAMRLDKNTYKLYRETDGTSFEYEYDEVHILASNEYGQCARLNLLTGPGKFVGNEIIITAAQDIEWKFEDRFIK